jgi:hypothetical protein
MTTADSQCVDPDAMDIVDEEAEQRAHQQEKLCNASKDPSELNSNTSSSEALRSSSVTFLGEDGSEGSNGASFSTRVNARKDLQLVGSSEGVHPDNSDAACDENSIISEAAMQQMHHKVLALEQQLEQEKLLRLKAQSRLKAVTNEWKKMAELMNKHEADGNDSNSFTDNDLKDLIGGLKYNIRTLAELYFDRSPDQPWPRHPRHEDGRPAHNLMPQKYEFCPSSAVVAQSYLWRVMRAKVFGTAEWAEKGYELSRLQNFLRPSKSLLSFLVYFVK